MHGSSWIYHHRFWTEYPTEYPTDAQQRPHLRVGVDSTAPNQVGYWTVDLNNLKPWQKSSVAQVCASQLSLISLNSFAESFPSWHAARWRHLAQGRRELHETRGMTGMICFFNAQRVQVTDGTSTLKWFHSMTQLNAVLHLGLRLRISRHRKPIRLRAHFCVNTISKAMVTIDVHNRDVVGSLRDAKITSTKDSLKFEFYPLHGWYKATLAEKESLLRVGWPTPERLYTQPDPMTRCEFCHVLFWKCSTLHRSILILFD